jgi:hypothetical protein
MMLPLIHLPFILMCRIAGNDGAFVERASTLRRYIAEM